MISNLIHADVLSYEVSHKLLSEVLDNHTVKDWMSEAEENVHVQLLKQEIDNLNDRRSNEGKHWLPTHVFYLLDFDCDRHARNKSEKNKWEKLQVRASLALGVPHRESSLPWMIYETLNAKLPTDKSS